ncbi:MAG: carbohydrate ABC transporter permease [Caldibacillus debilis]|jgi:raffinose/stachyose/melibiose transport system permease protein|uniref:Carbohydrate ABC transporter membrane protein 2, CUT1 family n=2 Tax=Caldibacillus debilis TaxID=301148 RepID=A0A420VGY4_9BACI|nr:carbohydrate ABC transporter permease [Caldibacillus debilis]MBO2482669.1 carbohydrate ABC transporter permease [Bacillaceae bacterium]MBY6270941.1 carbohydrate ABC transporter permease [Bacillaceae bacterium]REJ13505.1 MAG: carbohydrate ABC transporter permease [Caldibacillus debilis]REJ25174.1 MAG: carbohydrate ABC transporter permease [Caldibacillus debilis]REJ25561.1 MAG: carbohydrate ABC transporter permease [Caldibacillus debilis]
MRKFGYGILYVLLGFIAVVQIYPIFWLFLFSLKDNREIFAGSPFALPSQFRWENYQKVWEGGIGNYFFNSVWITVAATVITVLLASMTTFAITRMKWKLSKFVLGLFMIGLMIPIHSALIPLFNMYLRMNLIDHPLSLVLTYVAYNLPITVMIMLGFYSTIPREIEEAAIIDGCSVNKLFFRIILPMTTPVITTTAIINMIYNWNEFVFVNTFISSDKYKTLTVGMQNFIGQYMTDWGPIGATLIISILPIIIAFVFFSDKIVEGMSSTAIKG